MRMSRSTLRAAGLAALLSLTASATLAQAPRRDSDWFGAPTAEDLRKAYPPRALAERRGGTAILDCAVAVSGRLENCRVAGETPAGLGFGVAALSLADKFRMEPALRDGRPTAGGRVRIPVVFSLADQAIRT